MYNETNKTMCKDRKKERSATRAVILKKLAAKHGVTEQYARMCVKGFAESDKAAEIQADYKTLEKKINDLI